MIDFSNETPELELETLGMFHIVAYLHLFPEIQFPLNKIVENQTTLKMLYLKVLRYLHGSKSGSINKQKLYF